MQGLGHSASRQVNEKPVRVFCVKECKRGFILRDFPGIRRIWVGITACGRPCRSGFSLLWFGTAFCFLRFYSIIILWMDFYERKDFI